MTVIYQLHFSVLRQQHVRAADVSVNHVIIVQETRGLKKLEIVKIYRFLKIKYKKLWVGIRNIVSAMTSSQIYKKLQNSTFSGEIILCLGIFVIVIYIKLIKHRTFEFRKIKSHPSGNTFLSFICFLNSEMLSRLIFFNVWDESTVKN